jgi:ubiquinone/menaquinone biosynthesis C-methylase UbiE
VSDRAAVEATYTAELLEPSSRTPWDRGIEAVRRDLLRRWSRGTLLDVGCGTGVHLDARVDGGWTVGIDFTPSLLALARGRDVDPPPALAVADGHALPLVDASVDSVVCFSVLYIMRDPEGALAEIARVLRPGGIAVLDLGNRSSLMYSIVRAHHEDEGWPAHTTRDLAGTRSLVARLGDVLEWRSFQLLPMLRPAQRQRALRPLAHPGWKLLLGRQLRGRMLDEWISSTRFCRRYAFRHLVVVRRRP